jgi:septal ring-binding cell division protein DamX
LPAQPDKPLSGSQWLAAQRDENFTLQLFAVDHLDKVEHLTTNHPSVPLHLLIFESREPRFRLVHGAFSSEEQARLAHQTLPAELRGQPSNPLVRRIGDLREEQRSPPREESTSSVNPAIVYTLQVFASSNRENVDRLMARYQALNLRVHVSDDKTARYRVLYGHFDSQQAARDASTNLPTTMLEEVGQPLLRESTDFN